MTNGRETSAAAVDRVERVERGAITLVLAAMVVIVPVLVLAQDQRPRFHIHLAWWLLAVVLLVVLWRRLLPHPVVMAATWGLFAVLLSLNWYSQLLDPDDVAAGDHLGFVAFRGLTVLAICAFVALRTRVALVVSLVMVVAWLLPAVLVPAAWAQVVEGDGLALSRSVLFVVAGVVLVSTLVRARVGAAEAAVLARADAEQARRADALLRQTLRGVAHDLGQPLTALQGALTTLGNHPDLDPARRRELISMADRAVARTSDYLDDLVGMGEGRSAEAVSVVAVGAVVVDVLEELGQVDAVGIDDAEALAVWARPHALHRILLNLVDNARKYAPDSDVRVVVVREGNAVRIDVADDGPGMSPDVAARVFDEHFRAPGTVADVDGSGIGLAVVARLVEEQGGRIEVDSVEGEGTTFRTWLPSASG